MAHLLPFIQFQLRLEAEDIRLQEVENFFVLADVRLVPPNVQPRLERGIYGDL